MNRKTGLAKLAVLLAIIAAIVPGHAQAAPPAAIDTSAPPPPSADYWPTQGWRTSTPEQQGMDSATLAGLFREIQRTDYLNLHSVVVIRHGYIVAEAYFPPYQPGTPHDLASCTKSFVSTLVGIAIQKGDIDSLNHKLVAWFPDQALANDDARKQAVTLEHLLTMTSGMYWSDLETRRVFFDAPGRHEASVPLVLDEPMVTRPGESWFYNSGSSHLLSAILQKATGTSAFGYAQQYLFDPLGIQGVQWSRDQENVSIGAGFMSMTPRDLAKLGYLYLHNGLWDGQQIVPAEWVSAATQTRAEPTDPSHVMHLRLGFGYGYQWWTLPRLGAYMALGSGGQTLFVAPASDLVVVMTAAQSDFANEKTYEMIEKYMLGAVRSSGPLPDAPSHQAELLAQIRASLQPAPMAAPQPEIAGRLADKTYTVEQNALGIRAFALQSHGDEALFTASYPGGELPFAVGLDGLYRVTNLPSRIAGSQADSLKSKGRWLGPQTFLLNIEFTGASDAVQWQIFFEPGDRATVIEKNANGDILGTVRGKATAVWWFSLLLGGFGVWAVASRKIYLGGEYAVTGWAARGVGLLALAAALLRVVFHSDFNLDVGAYSLALIAIVSGMLARRVPTEAAAAAHLPATPRLRLSAWALTTLGVTAGSLLGVLLKDPDYFRLATVWEMVRLVVTALMVAGVSLAVLAYGNRARAGVSGAAAVAGALFIGFTFGYLAETILGAVWPMETSIVDVLKSVFRLFSSQSG